MNEHTKKILNKTNLSGKWWQIQAEYIEIKKKNESVKNITDKTLTSKK